MEIRCLVKTVYILILCNTDLILITIIVIIIIIILGVVVNNWCSG